MSQHSDELGIAAALAAAISLLERSPKTAAPSNKIFDQMLRDYRKALADWRKARAILDEAAKPAPPPGGPKMREEVDPLLRRAMGLTAANLLALAERVEGLTGYDFITYRDLRSVFGEGLKSDVLESLTTVERTFKRALPEARWVLYGHGHAEAILMKRWSDTRHCWLPEAEVYGSSDETCRALLAVLLRAKAAEVAG